MYHSPIQLDVFPTDVQMRQIDPARNMRRFYRLSVQRDLFGRASLVREWGRIGFRGQMMVETHPDEGARTCSAARCRRPRISDLKRLNFSNRTERRDGG